MSKFQKNFEESFVAHGGHAGPATLSALGPKIAELKAAGVTGKQAGIALAEQSKLHRSMEDYKELATPRPAHRPSPWSALADAVVNTRVPQHVSKAWRHFEFKKQVDKLALEFLEQMENAAK